MKMAIKTVKKVVLEVSRQELDTKGFENVWDEIRGKYPENVYDLHAVEDTTQENVMFFELMPKE
jgi:hypothetical protein